MNLNYYTLWYHIVATLSYTFVAITAFCAGGIIKEMRMKRKPKEIDGFALYKVAMKEKKDSAKIENRQRKQERWLKTFRVFKG